MLHGKKNMLITAVTAKELVEILHNSGNHSIDGVKMASTIIFRGSGSYCFHSDNSFNGSSNCSIKLETSSTSVKHSQYQLSKYL